jgi:hypothetical protein
MTDREKADAMKRAARLTEARLALARANRLCQLKPYPSEERTLIRDMRLAMQGLLDELGVVL